MLALILFADDGQTLFISIVALSFARERRGTRRLSDDGRSLKLLVSSRSVVAARKSFDPDKEEHIETVDLTVRENTTMMIRLTLVRKVDNELGIG